MSDAAIAPGVPPIVLTILLVTPGMVTGFAMTGLTPVLPLIEQAFGGSPDIDLTGKLTVAIVGLGVMIGALLSNFLVKRYGIVRTLGWSFACYGATAIISALAPDIYSLVGARLLNGLSASVGVTLIVALIGMLGTPAQRRSRFGHHIAFAVVAQIVLMPIAGGLGSLHWRLAPLLGVFAFAYLPIVYRLRVQLAALHLSVRGAKREEDHGLQLASSPTGLKIIVLAFALGVAAYRQPVFVPFKEVAVGLKEAWQIGLLSALGTVGALSPFFYGYLVARISVLNDPRGSIPPVAKVDLGVRYNFPVRSGLDLELTGFVKNVTDNTNYDGTTSGNSVGTFVEFAIPTVGRTWGAALTAPF